MMDRDSCEFVERNNVHDHGLEGYARLFDSCADANVRLESTTGYLYQQTALELLPGLPSKPRFVVILREPAARVFSTFRYFQGHKAQLPHDMTFRRFIDVLDSGDPILQNNEFLRDAIDHSRYAQHLAPWLERAGRERIRIVLFEEMRRNASTLVPDLAEWCGADKGFYESYAWPRRNESYEVRYPQMHAWVRGHVLPFVRSERIKRGLRGLYIAFNGRRARSTGKEEAEVLAGLRERFNDDNARLASEWELDLSSWSMRA